MLSGLRKKLLGILYIFIAVFPLLSRAEVYSLVPRPMHTDPGVVTVQEFFWYSCPHCYSIDPEFEKWTHSLPKDVKVEIIPAVANIYWRKMATLYYTLQDLGQLSKLHKKIFEAQHLSHVNLYDPDILKKFLTENKISWEKYQKVANSFGVTVRVKRSEDLVKNYGIEGVPAFVINGRYRVSVETAGSEKELLKAVSKTIAVARSGKK
ncbi:thiol:disulfide interchange protein DsbA/DsbL [Candidatus Ichthyocystis hellenicum]|uniref:thiol:disulfide interchange protein DsbA/DsbL n=1 Tax=Candidatus Ichthyocystis hellenicum TaxID=1561003 RepID=UPI000B845E83|nr:thiol:disulfide interchange protein DsbA/DsbL [Candidatus Ichthyocystis hellenicum]